MSRIRPLWLRELLFWQLLYPAAGMRLARGGEIEQGPALELAPAVSLRLQARDPGHLAIRYCGFLELRLSRRVAELAARGGTLVDVGANCGYFTALWAAAGAENRVVAFEPAQSAFALLVENIRSNGFGGRVVAHNRALGRDNATARFIDTPRGQSGLSHLTLAGEAHPDEAVIDVTTLDDILLDAPGDLHQVDLLKIDAEGADAWVLQGAERLLRSGRVRHVVFEHEPSLSRRLGVPVDESQRLLADCGYRSQRLSHAVWWAAIARER